MNMKNLASSLCVIVTMSGTGAPASTLIISGDDGKAANIGGHYEVDRNTVPDALVVLDASHFPLKIVGHVNIHHSVSAAPHAIALSPDQKLALIAAPNKIDPADPTKLMSEKFLQVVDLSGGKQRLVDRIDLPEEPTAVSISPSGKLAIAVYAKGKFSSFAIADGKVTLLKTFTLGGETSRLTSVGFTPDGKRAFIVRRGDDLISILTIEGGQVRYTGIDIKVGREPYDIDIAPNGAFAVVGEMAVAESEKSNRDAVAVIAPDHGVWRVVQSLTVPRSPEGVAISPDSRWIAVSSINGTNRAAGSPQHNDNGLVTLFSVAGAHATQVGDAPTGHNPQGVIFMPDSSILLVQNYMERQLAAFKVGKTGLEDTGVRIDMPGYPASIRAASTPQHQ